MMGSASLGADTARLARPGVTRSWTVWPNTATSRGREALSGSLDPAGFLSSIIDTAGRGLASPPRPPQALSDRETDHTTDRALTCQQP